MQHKCVPYKLQIRNSAITDYIDGMSSHMVAKKYNIKCHKTVMRWVKYLGKNRCKEESYKLESIRLKGIRRNPTTEFKKGQPAWNNGIEWTEMQGINHPNWRGGKRRYPIGWRESLREQVRTRDGRKCQLCGVPERECMSKLEVHHIDYNKDNLTTNNLISLCKSCHTKTGFHRETWKARFVCK